MHWDRAGKLLRGARTVVLTVGGFGLLSLAAFTAHPVAGFAMAGVSLLVIEGLTGDEKEKRQ